MDIKNKYTHYSADQLLNDFYFLESEQHPSPLPIQNLLPKEVKKPYYPESVGYSLWNIHHSGVPGKQSSPGDSLRQVRQ